VQGDKVEILKTWGGRDFSGDGTVPRVSAVPLENTDAQAGMFAGEQHGSLQNDDAVLTHLRGILTGRLLDLGMFEAVEPSRIGIEVEELFGPSEPIRIRARGDREDLPLTAQVQNADTGQLATTVDLRSHGDASYGAEVPPLPEGANSVTSLFSVVG
jgi:hypothetical protein